MRQVLRYYPQQAERSENNEALVQNARSLCSRQFRPPCVSVLKFTYFSEQKNQETNCKGYYPVIDRENGRNARILNSECLNFPDS